MPFGWRVGDDGQLVPIPEQQGCARNHAAPSDASAGLMGGALPGWARC